MITQFRIFEKNKDVYNVGDYVKLKMIPDYVNMGKFHFEKDDLYTKITETSDKYMNTLYRFQYPDDRFILGQIYLIRRLMTKKEITEYKLKEEAIKYNL